MNYYDYREQLEVLDEKIAFLKRDLRWLIRRNAPSGYGGADFSGEIHAPHNQEALTFLNEVSKLKAEIEELEARRDDIKTSSDKMIEIISKMESVDNKVVYLRDVCHLRLSDISEMLDYSYDHVKRISARNKKKPR